MTPSALVRALHRTAAQSEPTYTALCETVRSSPVVVPDETGWKVRGLLHWLWVLATATTTVYRICAGRGFDDAGLGARRGCRGRPRPRGLGAVSPIRPTPSIKRVWVISSSVAAHYSVIIHGPAFPPASSRSCNTPSMCATAAPPAPSRRTASMWRAGIS